MYKEIIKVLKEEIKYYSKINNEDWSKEKNEGFKKGIEYCESLIRKMSLIEKRGI